MTRYVTAFVGVSIIFLVFLGIAFGSGPMGWTLLGLIAAVGLLAIAVSRRGERGLASPGRCRECGGLISPNAPYCKHCGAIVADA